MPRRKVSNPLALAVLSCLAERPMHPYEMSTTMRERGKHESIKLNYGSLYSVVESLHKHGLIAPRETVKDGRRPERTVYEITSAGRLEFVDWLAELIGTPAKDYPTFEAGLSLIGGLPPDDAVGLLRAAGGGAALAAAGRRRAPALRDGDGRAGAVPHRGGLPARPDRGRDRVRRQAGRVDRRTAASTASTTGARIHRQYAAGEEVTPFRLPAKD